MQAPTRADYVRTYFTLFESFQQEREQTVHYGHPFEYEDQILIVFYTMMSIRRITAFKAQHRWLRYHLHEAIALGFEKIPHRITLSRTLSDPASVYCLCWSLGRSSTSRVQQPHSDRRCQPFQSTWPGLASIRSAGKASTRQIAQLGSGRQLA
jgi:hypothetical protein